MLMGLFFFVFQQIGRYSPVRRASEGSKYQPLIHGPLQECQQLIQQQKSLAQRNLVSAQSPPLMDNSSSLPGSNWNYFSFFVVIDLFTPPQKFANCVKNHF